MTMGTDMSLIRKVTQTPTPRCPVFAGITDFGSGIS